MNAMINKGLNGMRKRRRLLLIGGPALIVLAAAAIYLFTGRYVSTDDAYVQAARAEISANVAGQVAEVAVHDNQHVHKGDVLFKLDDRPFAIAAQDAKAMLADTKLRITALKATYRQRQADVQAAKDTLAYAARELKRQKKLASQGISSQASLDKAQHAFATAKQQVEAAGQQQENVRATLADNPDIAVTDHPAVQQAQAVLDRAELNLSYATIKAPSDGIVTKVEQLQPGDTINAGQPVFALVSDKDVWVEANFKETELTHMRPGQKATISIDSYPGKTFHGMVMSVSPGTGSSFSLLPPENATGNWVKVVQRLPVRVSIDDIEPGRPLQAGLSATVEVDTESGRSR